MVQAMKPITTYKRKRDIHGGLCTSAEDIRSSADSLSSPLRKVSPPSDIPSSPSSQSSSQPSSQQSSSQPSQSSPPLTSPKKLKTWDWWLAPKDTKQAKNTKTTPTKKGTPTKKKDKPKMEQMFLDLGQKNFDAKLCPECGMMYAPGVQEDSLMHTKFHAKHESIVNFPQWKSCRVVKEFSAGGGIICVGQDDTIANQNKVAKVRKLMDKELGYVDATNMNIEADQKIFLYITGKNKVVGCVVAEQIEEAFHVIIKDHSTKPDTEKEIKTNKEKPDSSSPPPSSAYPTTPPLSPSSPSSSPSRKPSAAETDDLDLDKIMEIDTSNKNKNKNKNKKDNKNPKGAKADSGEDTPKNPDTSKKVGEAMKKFSVSCGKEPQKAVCGISRIWTARSHRRQGIASKLLDAVRANMIYGYTVPKELCAFSQPTADGKLFFESYRGTKEFLVYL